MPIYEYECRDCGSRFEKIIYGTAEPHCPSCNSADLSRLLSTFAVSTGLEQSCRFRAWSVRHMR